MASGKLSSVLKLFENDPTPEEQAELKKEVMLLVLARATAADTNIKDVEIEKVREVLSAHLDTEFDAGEVRIAANSELYERAPLKKILSTSAARMREEDKIETIQALAEVIAVDGRVSALEIAFFNDVATAMSLTPAEIMGLQQEVTVRGS